MDGRFTLIEVVFVCIEFGKFFSSLFFSFTSMQVLETFELRYPRFLSLHSAV